MNLEGVRGVKKAFRRLGVYVVNRERGGVSGCLVCWRMEKEGRVKGSNLVNSVNFCSD